MSLATALRNADEAYLTGMSNKGLYKRAVKDLASAEGTVTYTETTAEVTICGETCSIRDPLWECTCSCPSRSICRHILTAILWLKAQPDTGEPEEPEEPAEAVPPETPAVPESPPELEKPSEPEETAAVLKDADAVRECAGISLALLADVLQWGLVRMPESMAENLEAAAVRSHARRMADAERLLRELGSAVRSCRERRAVFRTERFLSLLTQTAQHLQSLCGENITEEMLGVFRRTYTDYPGDLRLLPVGEREILSDEYEGKLWYFLNLDEAAERRFLVCSDMRPKFYDTVKTRKNNLAPWGAGMTMEKLMRQQITLVNARISGDKISTSKETQLAARTNANLNCKELTTLIRQDFRQAAVRLSETPPGEEALCFICPERCLASRFDTHAQQLRMTMQDTAGNHADLRVNYRKETKEFIEELERIGRIMLEKPEKPYVWLCSAKFEDGELVFFPIEVYNFIEPPPPVPYRLPPQYAAKENTCAPQILEFFDEITDWLGELVQCGIRSAPDGEGKRLARKAERCGMEGLAGILTALGTQAENVRHTIRADTAAALDALIQAERYLTVGREKLALITALNAMQRPV